MRLVTRVRQARIACPAGRGHRHFNNFAYQVAALTQRLRMQNDCAVRLRGKHIHLLYPQLSENKRLKKIGLKVFGPGKNACRCQPGRNLGIREGRLASGWYRSEGPPS